MDKNLLLQSVIGSELYTFNQSRVLQKMIDISIGNKFVVSQEYLSKSLKISRATVYLILKALTKDGVISKDKFEKNTYFFDEEKLKYILEVYKKKNG